VSKGRTQPGLGNSLHAARQSPAAPGQSGLPRRWGQAKSWGCSPGKGQAKGLPRLPTTIQRDGGQQLEPDFEPLEVTFSFSLKLGGAQGQDKQ